jgi:D-serine deaminase-like pyridoxal phosphate-dependent protein
LDNYPLANHASIVKQHVGKKLQDLPTPAVILDRSKIIRNCNAMLQVCQELDVGFRAHVKSHKTLELAKLQIGETGPANFIVSTVVEAEHLLPFVKECQSKGRGASVRLHSHMPSYRP